MKLFLTLIISLSSVVLIGQTQYEIDGFSSKYKGIVTIDEGYDNEVFKKGEIAIIEVKTNKEIIAIQADELTFELDDKGMVKTNVVELPYGEQSLLIYQDFNFDGVKDLAIMDGQFSCYHGPSFQIYLDTAQGLVHSPEFTRLAQEYCGMFQTDYDSQTIHTMTKSGCCWHQFSEFIVQDNKPVVIHIIEIGLGEDFITEEYTEMTRVGEKMIEEKYSFLSDEADMIEVYAMSFKNGKQMAIYRVFAFEDYLFYVFMNKEGKIELMYSEDFVYDTSKETLTFQNNDTVYEIYNGGIIVHAPHKKVDIKAKIIDDNGTLTSLSSLNLKNLTIK